MSNRNKRYIHHYDMVFRPSDEKAPPIKLSSLIEPIMQAFEEENLTYLVNNETAIYRIVDIQHRPEQEKLILLLHFSDTAASNPTFSHINTGDIRVVPKEQGEGNASSAHIVISLGEVEPKNASYYSYYTFIEHVSYFNRSILQNFFRKIFKRFSDDGHIQYETDKGEQKKYRPLIELRGHPSQKLSEIVHRNQLSSIELIDINYVSKMDEETYIKETKRHYTKKIVADLTPTGQLNAVMKQIGIAKKDDFSRMRISFKRSHNERDLTVPIDLEREEVDSTLLIKANMLELEEPLEDCEPKIRSDLVSQILSLPAAR